MSRITNQHHPSPIVWDWPFRIAADDWPRLSNRLRNHVLLEHSDHRWVSMIPSEQLDSLGLPVFRGERLPVSKTAGGEYGKGEFRSGSIERF